VLLANCGSYLSPAPYVRRGTACLYRFEGWGWPLVSGVIDLALGGLICLQWPVSALWVLGLFVGISLVFRGFNWIGLGVALRARNAPREMVR
jgi:uncharacterized membrane protein HdeD (DUF308 family)